MIKKPIEKIVIILLVIVTLSNFITSNYVFASGVLTDSGMAESQFGSVNQIEDKTNQVANVFKQEDEEVGMEGALFTPITQFLVAVADSVMAIMHSAFIGSGSTWDIITKDEIKIESPSGGLITKGVTRYILRYTPAAIFSGDIPAFDTNFFEPMGNNSGEVVFNEVKFWFDEITSGVPSITYNQCISRYGAPNTNLNGIADKLTTAETLAAGVSLVCMLKGLEAVGNMDWDVDFQEVSAEFMGVGGSLAVPIPEFDYAGMFTVTAFLTASGLSFGVYEALELQDANVYYTEWVHNGETYFFIADSYVKLNGNATHSVPGRLFKIGKTETPTVKKYSAAFMLQPVVSKWYSQLRKIALVGLLSVLIYVGIRVIISSTSQEKAKYKKMLVDWAAAICLLFILHYIMVIIAKISGSLIDILDINSSWSDGGDVFATTIRNRASGEAVGSYTEYFGYVVIYIALVILTVVFTIQYTKRLILLAFLTMIAPLIALTYPIDKITDGKAQAFSYWIKEYIFNSLLQPMHLLLYTIFISSATEIMDMNPVYAVVVLMFFTSAEQIFRRIFGFDKASTVDKLGAAAGGALVMNALNKMRGSGKKDKDKQKGNQNKIRMARNNTGNDAGDSGNNPGGSGDNPGGSGDNPGGSGDNPGGSGDNTDGDGTAPMRTSDGQGNDSGDSPDDGGVIPVHTNNGQGDDSGENSDDGGATPVHTNDGQGDDSEENPDGEEKPKDDPISEKESRNAYKKAEKEIKRFKRNVKRARRYQKLQPVGKVIKRTGVASAAPRVLRKATGVIAGATIGLGATVASGGDNAATFIGGGAVAGAAVVDNAGKKVENTVSNAYQNIQNAKRIPSPKEQKMIDEYKRMLVDSKIQDVCKKNKLEVKDVIKSFIDEGITDPKEIREAIENETLDPKEFKKK